MKTAASASSPIPSGDLFKLEDRSIIVVEGKPVTAGSVKAKMNADFKARAGAAKVMKASPRKLDLGTMNVMSYHGGTGGAKVGTLADRPGAAAVLGSKASPGKASVLVNSGAADAVVKSQCLDKGPPTLLEVGGKVRANGSVTLTGYCFGDKPGHVEVMGQFAGGKLVPAFSAWTRPASRS